MFSLMSLIAHVFRRVPAAQGHNPAAALMEGADACAGHDPLAAARVVR